MASSPGLAGGGHRFSNLGAAFLAAFLLLASLLLLKAPYSRSLPLAGFRHGPTAAASARPSPASVAEASARGGSGILDATASPGVVVPATAGMARLAYTNLNDDDAVPGPGIIGSLTTYPKPLLDPASAAEPAGAAECVLKCRFRLSTSHRPTAPYQWPNPARAADGERGTLLPVTGYVGILAAVAASFGAAPAPRAGAFLTPQRGLVLAWAAAMQLALPVVVEASSSTCSASAYSSAVLADGPWGYWRLDEPSGSIVAYDCSGYGRNATYQGGVTPGTAGRGPGFSAAAIAPSFDGSSGYVQLPTIPSSTAGGPFGAAYSIEIWFSLSAFSFWERLFDLGTGPNNYNILLGFPYQHVSVFLFSQPDNGFALSVSGGSIPSLGSWYHTVFTVSSPVFSSSSYAYRVNLYINGATVGSWSMTVSALQDPTRTSNFIGKSNYFDPYLSGSVAEAVSTLLRMT